MTDAKELVEAGRRARNEGRTEEALALYVQAVEVSRVEGDLVRWAHSLRHYADMELKLGRVEEARRDIAAVIAFYRKNGTGELEMGNTLRIAALVEEAAGDNEEARQRWAETLALYVEVGVEAGINECREHLS